MDLGGGEERCLWNFRGVLIRWLRQVRVGDRCVSQGKQASEQASVL